MLILIFKKSEVLTSKNWKTREIENHLSDFYDVVYKIRYNYFDSEEKYNIITNTISESEPGVSSLKNIEYTQNFKIWIWFFRCVISLSLGISLGKNPEQ